MLHVQTVCCHLGSAVGFYSGNVLELLDDVQVGGYQECIGDDWIA
jgi:hypothetical protein